MLWHYSTGVRTARRKRRSVRHSEGIDLRFVSSLMFQNTLREYTFEIVASLQLPSGGNREIGRPKNEQSLS